MKKILFLLLFLLLSFWILASRKTSSFASPSLDKNSYVSEEVIVQFKPLVPSEIMEKIARISNSRIKEKLYLPRTVILKVPSGEEEKIIDSLSKNPLISYAEPNYVAYALMVPNDTYYRYQWHFDNSVYGGIQMREAWDISSGQGVTVAVIDTGIRKGTDLDNTCFVSGWDFINNDSDPIDDNGHGTHVAGTIAQSTNNSLGVAGIAYDSCLMPVKVLDNNGSGTYAQVANGIYYAANNGAKVINLSLGGSASDNTLREAVKYAYEKGVTIVAACGNDNRPACLYPAAYDDYVIAVGATQYDETKAPYSNYGSSLDLVAPGGNTNLDQNKDGYGDGVLQQSFSINGGTVTWNYYFLQGTSMATPHVSGVAALLIANGNASNPNQIREILQSTAEDKGTIGRDNIYGWGLINAAAALKGVVTPTPLLSPSPTPSPVISPNPSPSVTPSPTSTPTPTKVPGEPVLCWSGKNEYLYRSADQVKKFCKCAQGEYGHKGYWSSRGKKTVYYYLDTGDNENWNVASKSSFWSVYKAICLDGNTYLTNQDYFYNK